MGRGLQILSIALAMFVGSECQSITVSPPYDILYVIAPSAFNLSCNHITESNSGSDIEWKKDGVKITEETKHSTISGDKKKTVLNIVKPSSSAADAGQYDCVESPSGTKFSITVVVAKVNSNDVEFKRNMGSVKLGCETEGTGFPTNYTVTWEREHQPITTIEDYEEKYTVNNTMPNHTLEIKNAERADAGAYQCVFDFSSHANGSKVSQKVSVTANLFASPLIRRFEKSKNLIQRDPLELKCGVYGHPLGNITWSKDGVVLVANERIKFNPGSGLDNGILSIEHVEFEDKGTYMCLASSVRYNTTANSTILVRVKDKLAALWPFLGIVAEVVILCIIIFIYEKKRSKEDPADNDETDVKSGSANANEANEVRQRNVRA
ncbi:neuroplastin [Patella vulgata]|uniref:neuroplastin n=1 Tax=Patella vulgata TaxID=6465 RepID=UPI00217F42E7|nr:neuroplastin [Patella vulgata]